MKTVVLFDMDGVLCRFREVPVEETYKRGYFASLEQDGKIAELIRLLVKDGTDVRILSSVYENGHAKAEKEAWLIEHDINVPRIFVPYGRCKADYVRKDERNILIDDHTPNLLSWNGQAVKYYNGINGKKGRWKGESIRWTMPVQEMYRIVKEILSTNK